ncbi:hypothetical protein FJZ19_03375 [Candidatus Pacearchaeota archaeon]|nr:hypothetical protein [Candidatus Pacearchaeota archaeon]
MAKEKGRENKDGREEKQGELEKDIKLYTPDDLPEETHLYMPPQEEREGFLDSVKDYWDEIKPKDAFGYAKYAALSTMPAAMSAYMLWKLPPRLHEDMNYVLSSATGISAAIGQEEVALATGIAYAVSQAVYGIKIKSGHHVLSGLQGIVTGMKKVDKSGMNKADKTRLDKALTAAEALLKYFSTSSMAKKKAA